MIQEIINKLNLDKQWAKIDLGTSNTFYMIAVRKAADKKDTINPVDVDKIYFEVGVDSGVKNKPITVDHICLDFVDQSSDTEDINSITAFINKHNYLRDFYIRPVKMVLKDGKYLVEGKCNITININVQ